MTFSIHRTALTEIQRIFGYSKSCLDPVAQLYETADPRHIFGDSLDDGTKTTEELTAIARNRLEEVASEIRDLQFSLMVGAAERADCQSSNLYEIGGITFAMDGRIVEILRDYCLMFENGHFHFRGADNTAYALSSILARRASHQKSA